MFGSSKNGGGQPPERAKTGESLAEQFDDIPPMPEGFKPPPAQAAAAPTRKAFNFPEKSRPQAPDDAAQLLIGANIRLKGEIAACDLMRVEGVYEGIAKARQLVVNAGGSFLGTADVEEAEIHGTFEGSLHVSGRLFLRKQGKIRGNFSYGQLEIERGGEIDGRILPLKNAAASPVRTVEPAAPPKAVPAPKPAPPPAAAAVPPPKPAVTVNGAGAAPAR